MYAPLEVMREIPALLRHSDWKVTGTIALVPGGLRLIDLQENDTSHRLYGAAVDLWFHNGGCLPLGPDYGQSCRSCLQL